LIETAGMACKLGFCYEGIPGPGPLLPRSAVPIAQGMPCGISRGPGHCAKSAHEAVLQFSRDMTALSSWHRRASIPAKTQNQPLHQQLTKLGLKSPFRLKGSGHITHTARFWFSNYAGKRSEVENIYININFLNKL